MIEKELFINQYKAVYARFMELINSSKDQNVKLDEYDKLICDIETLIDVIPSVDGINTRDWKNKLVKVKQDIFNEMVMLNQDELNY